ncbi:Vms1/Ankzf1 family peptidyl-tRNA hydrolase [Natrarchaeobaculum aegyptiacum]|uniref:Actinobacteria/chloroflexi VLRF1 release factor domain-containing protein n=1 Tax=Natrarchaeobaculum aegyptiacum TaxID=745377 RepID=A0A2Z2HZF3_9EURY|nr:Vms1/Ankzf1 family peptidyl-tRNA hydrolase [Natrarchaeobaculum aegyptiacum]ARS91357.1 hypothetical protein B1756_17610 [Natrarchaeobaculum aegyptiacum]
MFDVDELLGRASLKDRIAELEEETDRLQSRYEAEKERRAEATTAKQEADRRINRLEDRIAQLEGELERERDDDRGLEYRRRDRLRGRELEAVVDRLASVRTGPEGSFTAVLEDDERVSDLDHSLQDLLDDRLVLLEDAAPCLCYVDDAGLLAVALDPPVRPVLEPTWDDRFVLEREWFLPTDEHLLAVVRADLFAVGVYEDDERLDSRGFESDVKGSHSKGGFSQARFERIRDEQIDAHLERAAEAIAAVRGDVGDVPLYLTGQRGVVETLVEEAGFEPAATAAVDATGDPTSALEAAERSFWTTDCYVL